MDDTDLQQRVERQQVLVSGLKEHEPLYDHIFVLGEGLVSLCSPTAGVPINDKLETTQEQWEELKIHCVQEQESLKGNRMKRDCSGQTFMRRAIEPGKL